MKRTTSLGPMTDAPHAHGPPDLEERARKARKDAEGAVGRASGLVVVAFLDLAGSTAGKLVKGNTAASLDALTFTSLATEIAAGAGGRVVKTLGDGALAMFDDPVAACGAALDLRHATYEYLNLEMTAGLTSGRPIRLSLGGGTEDLLGDVVDRAARIQSLASPGQVLVDGTLFNQVRADIAGRPGWDADLAPRRAHAKGIGPIELYELALMGHWTRKEELATPFNVIAGGRPSLEEKLALLRNAKTEIVEMGIGLTSFAKYFEGQKPEEFRDPIRSLVRAGVDLRCFVLDEQHEPGRAWMAEQGNPDYAAEAEIARRRMEQEGRYYRNQHYRGRLSVHRYQRVPEFWCLGVDVDDAVDGRMFFAPYLMGVARAQTPVMQVSRSSSPALYEKYLQSVRALRAASDEAL